MSGAEKQAVIRDFKDAVNMSPQELTRWLEAAESKEVGYKTSQGDESVGHASGRRIIELLGKQEADFSDDDVQHAPEKCWAISTATWRSGLMATSQAPPGATH